MSCITVQASVWSSSNADAEDFRLLLLKNCYLSTLILQIPRLKGAVRTAAVIHQTKALEMKRPCDILALQSVLASLFSWCCEGKMSS